MNRRSASSLPRSPEARTAAACSSAARAYVARTKTVRASSDKQRKSDKNSNHSGGAKARSSSNLQENQLIALPIARVVNDKASRTPKQQHPKMGVLLRGMTPKSIRAEDEASSKRMKVNLPSVVDSPASTLTTLSSTSSASTAVSSELQSKNSGGARSTGASTVVRKLVIDDEPQKQPLNIFMANLYNPGHLLELFCIKNNPSDEERVDFMAAPFSAILDDVLQAITPSENKCAYAKLCSELGEYCDPKKVTTKGRIQANLKDLVISHYEKLS